MWACYRRYGNYYPTDSSVQEKVKQLVRSQMENLLSDQRCSKILTRSFCLHSREPTCMTMRLGGNAMKLTDQRHSLSLSVNTKSPQGFVKANSWGFCAQFFIVPEY
ncbi:MAG: hypothetical protein KGH75_12975 [Rhodospirillales bacterium]|nr:hypothetical protein [Rhodospirillales bacterium]